MKSVIFFRHGKSDWDAEYGPDHDRPLAKRGIKAARKMGKYLAETDQLPDLVITSTAERARRTATLAHEAGDWDASVRETRQLYDTSTSTVVDVLNELPDDVSTVVLVGHEPVWSMSIGMLTGGSVVHFPTAAMARLDFEVDQWTEVGYGRGKLAWLTAPKSLPG